MSERFGVFFRNIMLILRTKNLLFLRCVCSDISLLFTRLHTIIIQNREIFVNKKGENSIFFQFCHPEEGTAPDTKEQKREIPLFRDLSFLYRIGLFWQWFSEGGEWIFWLGIGIFWLGIWIFWLGMGIFSDQRSCIPMTISCQWRSRVTKRAFQPDTRTERVRYSSGFSWARRRISGSATSICRK